ncbi:MAG: NYN domain-containing protein [Deltaproteobacteria bacterium]|jgi:uncharacterized LabA/DUF88 family protein|nr:NYN domain-containing protein [Deltaproteobacteria bacterium]
MNTQIKTTAALIIDVENLIGSYINYHMDSVGMDANRYQRTINFDIGPVIDAIIQMYGSLHFRISIGDIFYSCKRTNFMDLNILIKKNFHENLIDIHEVTNFDNVKDCTDFVIYTETLDLAYREESIDSFAIFSADKGFMPLYIKLKQLGKKVTVVGMSENQTPANLARIVDNIIYYTDLYEATRPQGQLMDPGQGLDESPAQNKITLISANPGASTLIEPAFEGEGEGKVQDDFREGQGSAYDVSTYGETMSSIDGSMYESSISGESPEMAEAPLEKELVEQELPEWVNFDNYQLALKILKCVENKLNCPVLSRDHYAAICSIIERIFADINKRGGKILLTDLSYEITKLILDGRDLITGADLQLYNQDDSSLFTLGDKIAYKVLRTLYMRNVFQRLPNEDAKTPYPTLGTFVNQKPELLENLFSSFFGMLKNQNLPIRPEALTMAFYSHPTTESLDEMTEFIRKHKIYRSFTPNQFAKPHNPFTILNSAKR